jgi:hypothetical protein
VSYLPKWRPMLKDRVLVHVPALRLALRFIGLCTPPFALYIIHLYSEIDHIEANVSAVEAKTHEGEVPQVSSLPYLRAVAWVI